MARLSADRSGGGDRISFTPIPSLNPIREARMTPEAFHELFATFETSAFRLQLWPEYDVPSERSEFVDYHSGRALPDRTGNSWLTTMAGQVARGRRWTNVHLLPAPLTPYLQYLIDWWYVDQARVGAEILFVPPEFAGALHTLASCDFWLFDDCRLILMRYDMSGRFLGAEAGTGPAALEGARRVRDFALQHAIDLQRVLEDRRAGRLI